MLCEAVPPSPYARRTVVTSVPRHRVAAPAGAAGNRGDGLRTMRPSTTAFYRPRWLAAAAGLLVMATAVPVLATVPYAVHIEGVADDDLRDLLLRASRLESLKAEPPASRAGLERRIEDDIERLTAVLRSKGFYGGRIEPRLVDGDPADVHLTVETGPVYLLADYEVTYVGAAPRDGLPTAMDNLDLEAGMWAEAAPIDAASGRLLDLLGEAGRPLARVVDKKYVVDHRDTTLAATLSVDPGPPSRFGATAFSGQRTVDLSYLRRFIPWHVGDTYDARKVATLRERLMGTGLFNAVQVDHGEAPDADGLLALAVTVEEAKPRSIALGAGYASDEGFSVEASWEHRNLFGAQESLRVDGEFGETVRSLSASARKPNVLVLDQDLLADVELKQQDSDAFDENALTTFVGVERRFGRHWRVRGGPSFEYSEQNDNQGTRTFKLVGLPLSGTYDNTDSILDPTNGARLTLAVTPYAGVLGRDVGFVSSELYGSVYEALDDDDRFVAAARFRIGSIAGEDTAFIPASKRFYAGGGGSIRGYEFQSVGPLDAVNDPLGGRSAIEVGAEMRIRVFGDFGIVPFIEGGNVYDGAAPEAFTDALWAAGLGLRYFTPVGPLRLDFGFPINGRDGVDDAFQFYISLGQAF